jgi:hypothetical protein
MGFYEMLVIRIVLSVLFAVLICRIFFQETPMLRVAGLGVFLLGFAYLLEYLRKRKGGKDGK